MLKHQWKQDGTYHYAGYLDVVSNKGVWQLTDEEFKNSEIDLCRQVWYSENGEMKIVEQPTMSN